MAGRVDASRRFVLPVVETSRVPAADTCRSIGVLMTEQSHGRHPLRAARRVHGVPPGGVGECTRAHTQL